MGNISFTHQSITNGATQCSAGTMQSVFDALRKLVDKTYRGSTEKLQADEVPDFGIGVTITLTDLHAPNFTNLVAGTPVFFITGYQPMNRPGTTNYFWGYYIKGHTSLGADSGVIVAHSTGGASYTKAKVSGTWDEVWQCMSVETNGGQPPAPKPRSATDSDIGQWVKKFASPGADLATPSGGTWAYFAIQYDQTSGGIYNDASGVAAGGTTILSAVANKVPTGFFYKVA